MILRTYQVSIKLSEKNMILNRTKKNPISDKKSTMRDKKRIMWFSCIIFTFFNPHIWVRKHDFKLDKKKGLRGLRGFHTWFLLFTTLISDVWKKYQDRCINFLLAKIYKSTLLLSLFSSIRSSKSALCCIKKSSIKPNIFCRILVKMKKM